MSCLIHSWENIFNHIYLGKLKGKWNSQFTPVDTINWHVILFPLPLFKTLNQIFDICFYQPPHTLSIFFLFFLFTYFFLFLTLFLSPSPYFSHFFTSSLLIHSFFYNPNSSHFSSFSKWNFKIIIFFSLFPLLLNLFMSWLPLIYMFL